jgi:hypothetical protein
LGPIPKELQNWHNSINQEQSCLNPRTLHQGACPRCETCLGTIVASSSCQILALPTEEHNSPTLRTQSSRWGLILSLKRNLHLRVFSPPSFLNVDPNVNPSCERGMLLCDCNVLVGDLLSFGLHILRYLQMSRIYIYSKNPIPIWSL